MFWSLTRIFFKLKLHKKTKRSCSLIISLCIHVYMSLLFESLVGILIKIIKIFIVLIYTTTTVEFRPGLLRQQDFVSKCPINKLASLLNWMSSIFVKNLLSCSNTAMLLMICPINEMSSMTVLNTMSSYFKMSSMKCPF